MEYLLFGDHHIYGPEGVRFYTRYKAVTQRWTAGDAAGTGVHDADAGAVVISWRLAAIQIIAGSRRCGCCAPGRHAYLESIGHNWGAEGTMVI